MKRDLVTQEERETIDRINNDCLAMHVCPPPVTFVGMEVKDAGGNLVDSFIMKSNSWVRNMYNYIAWFCLGAQDSSTYGPNGLGNKTYAGVGLTNNIAGQAVSAGLSGDNTFGIVVGAGDTAESLESFSLASIIASGNSAGQLAYTAGTKNYPTYDSGTKKWTMTLSRIFNNNSGASVTVKEVGQRYGVTGSPLICRDVLVSPVAVPNGGQLTVTYAIEMTFPG